MTTSNLKLKTSSFFLTAIAAIAAVASLAARSDQGTTSRESFFLCGIDQILPEPIPMTVGNIILAGDARGFIACPFGSHTEKHREGRESMLVADALRDGKGPARGTVVFASGAQPPTDEMRWRAAQASARRGYGLGMLMPPTINKITPACNPVVFVVNDHEGTWRWQPGQWFFLAMDRQINVRMEALYAIGVQLASPTSQLKAAAVEAAVAELQQCEIREQRPDVDAIILEAIGAARHAAKDAEEVGAYLVDQSRIASNQRILGAVKGLEALTRSFPAVNWSLALKTRLRELALYGSKATQLGADSSRPQGGDTDARIRRLALMAMRSARDFDVLTLSFARQDTDFQVRRLVAMSLNLSDPNQAAFGADFANDPAFHVRYEYLVPLQRQANQTGVCAPMAKFFKDPSPTVVMRAMDLVPAKCTDLEDILAIIEGHAEKLDRNESFTEWHLPSRALSALARLNPARAKSLLPTALAHPVWQVRAASAGVAATLQNAAAAESLTKDLEPNVRTAALEALARLKSPALYEAAIDALNTQSDYQLLRAAALNLRNVPEELKPRAIDVLISSLRKLTDEESDTSRDTRTAILDRLADVLPRERAGDVVQYLADYDDAVVEAASKAYVKLVEASPGEVSRRRRYPYQPSESALYSLPSKARIVFEGGAAIIEFRHDAAPVTVARIHALINEGYFDGKTFHRVVPNFVVQGGSPGKNEYAGVKRFMRDEPSASAPHVRGALGISTRGKDTGDAQIFIDLIDQPRLDRDYTVFAYVVEGMDVIDRLLEGAVIVSISIIP